MGINPGPGAVRDATSAAPAVLMKRLRGEGHLTYRDISLYTAICATVSAVFQIEMDSLFAPTRCKADKAFARQVAVYLAHIVGSKSYTEIGIVFGRDRTRSAPKAQNAGNPAIPAHKRFPLSPIS